MQPMLVVARQAADRRPQTTVRACELEQSYPCGGVLGGAAPDHAGRPDRMSECA